MRHPSPLNPAWLLLFVFVLWGIAGKLDEPFEGWDDPTQSSSSATSPEVRMQCRIDDALKESSRVTRREITTVSFRDGRSGFDHQRLRDPRIVLVCVVLTE